MSPAPWVLSANRRIPGVLAPQHHALWPAERRPRRDRVAIPVHREMGRRAERRGDGIRELPLRPANRRDVDKLRREVGRGRVSASLLM